MAAFGRRFAPRYGYRPRFVAVLGHDAALIAATLATDPARGAAPFSRDALTRPTGFEGAVGALRLEADGTTTRGLAVFEVADRGCAVGEPAPRRFGAGL
ncbi:MAG: hypothetical protein ACFBWO_04780 [Paracoccaceae bacterium]